MNTQEERVRRKLSESRNLALRVLGIGEDPSANPVEGMAPHTLVELEVRLDSLMSSLARAGNLLGVLPP